MAKAKLRPAFNNSLNILIILLLCGILQVSYWYFYIIPGEEELKREIPEGSANLVIGSQSIGRGNYLQEENEVIIPFWVLKKYIDPSAKWYPLEQTLIITTADKVVRLQKDKLSAIVNNRPVDLRFPVVLKNDYPYVPLNFLKDLYEINIEVHPEKMTVVLDKLNQPFLTGKVITQKAVLREGLSLKDAVLKSLLRDQKVIIYGEEDGWYQVKGPEGELGYIHKSSIELGNIETLRGEKREQFVPYKPTGGKINLTWEHVIQQNLDTDKIPPMPGLNVISPTWFHLIDEVGNLKNLADPGYVEWAHTRGYQVWALCTNSFDRDLTRAVLSSPGKREYLINQLLIFSDIYGLNGINIDFENMYVEDRENFVQFMRELAPLLHEQELTLSVDVTFHSSSLHWSQIYERKALGEIADYVMVMAYDEHWRTSPVSGSVSSLPWVERGLQNVLKEVPPEKIVLGVPFYTRLWMEESQKGGGVQVSSQAYSMGGIESLLNQKESQPVWSTQTGQFYAEFTSEEGRFRTWLEEEKSIASRIDLVRKYNLAGVASWRRGFEKPEIWKVIENTLTKRPRPEE